MHLWQHPFCCMKPTGSGDSKCRFAGVGILRINHNFSVEYLHVVIHEEEGSPICLIDKISQKGESEEEKVVENILLKEVLGKLEKRERQIIMLRYFEDRTQSEIGELLNISQVQVSRIEKRILYSMKQKLVI